MELTCHICNGTFEGQMPTADQVQSIIQQTGAPTDVQTMVVCAPCYQEQYRKIAEQAFMEAGPPKYHNSHDLLKDEAGHVVKETCQVCERYDIPYVMAFESQWDAEGSHYETRVFLPANRRRGDVLPVKLALCDLIFKDQEFFHACVDVLEQMQKEKK